MIDFNPLAIAGLFIVITCLGLIVILLRHGKTKIHKLWVLFNFVVGIWGLGVFFIATSSTEDLAIKSWQFAIVGGLLIPVCFFHVVNVFCESQNRKMVIFAYSQSIFFILTYLLFPKMLSRYDYLFNSFYYLRGTNPLFYVLTFFWFFFMFFGHYKLFKFYKKASELKKKQILYFFFGMCTGFVGGSMNFLPYHYIDIYPYGNFLIPIYCIVVTYAILRHHLMDINIVIQKSFIYSILIAFITSVYFVFVFIAEKVFQGMVGYTSLFISLACAFFITLFFNPLKIKIQNLADIIFLGRSPIQIAKENELLRHEVEQTERFKAVATLASGMAHEIKNPLTAIKTFSEYLPQKHNDPEFINKFSRLVTEQVDRIDNLVHELLDFSKSKQIEPKPTNIHSLIDSTLDLLSNDFLKHNINLVKEYAEPNFIIQVDPNRMKEAFLNLFLNAIEAMPNGGTLTVKTSLKAKGSKLG